MPIHGGGTDAATMIHDILAEIPGRVTKLSIQRRESVYVAVVSTKGVADKIHFLVPRQPASRAYRTTTCTHVG